MERKIQKIDFTNQLILTTTTDGQVFYRSLDAFPLLKNAVAQQRNAYMIGRWGDDVRWEAIDEDIHISSLTKHPYHACV